MGTEWWAGWRRGRVLAEAERQQERERVAARSRILDLANAWDGPTSGWPVPPVSSLRVGSAPYYTAPEPGALRRQVRAGYVATVVFLALALAFGAALLWGPR
jgi:hypothetical protein